MTKKKSTKVPVRVVGTYRDDSKKRDAGTGELPLVPVGTVIKVSPERAAALIAAGVFRDPGDNPAIDPGDDIAALKQANKALSENLEALKKDCENAIEENKKLRAENAELKKDQGPPPAS